MSIKKTLLCLQAAAILICQSSIINISNVTAEYIDDGYKCSDIEVYFTEGYGWSSGDPSSKDSREFAEQIGKLMRDEDTGSRKKDFKIYSRTAIVDYVTYPTWFDAANIVLNPIRANQLRDNIARGGKFVAKDVNYNEYVGRCSETKYIIAGFGTGAAKVRESLQYINPDKVLYVALFSDPTLYLPEGKGPFPDACAGRNLSDYRMYVPNCRTHDGILGGANPYIPDGYEGKVGTWCHKNDMFCGSGLSMSGHSRYKEDGLYNDAAKVVYDKIRQEYNLDPEYSPHDTAILIDSTGSMRPLINAYKEEALNLAKQTLETGGRVALYDYRDYAESYYPVQHCNFETCTLEIFKEELNKIKTSGGGEDTEESLLWSSKLVMNELKWKRGATKSLIVLTDAWYHDPDLDGTTMADIVNLSKQIDPVNIYVITRDDTIDEFYELTGQTDGAVVSIDSDLSLLTAKIMERYDSLPRVEEVDTSSEGDISDVELIKAMLAEKLAADEEPITSFVEPTDSGTPDDSTTPDDSAESTTPTDSTPITPDSSEFANESYDVEIAPAIIIPKAPNTGRR